MSWQQKLEKLRYSGGLKNAMKSEKERKPFSWRGGSSIRYAGRDQSAAPATGIKKIHKFEEETMLSEALFEGKLMKPKEMVNGVPKFV
jgi:2-oxoglutarate dehydrogenase E1 component